eukprot:Platyproteum_vivax@DN7375_c0_g1_i2.p1
MVDKPSVKGLGAVKKYLKRAVAGKSDRRGYQEGDDFRTCLVTAYFESKSPAEVLITTNKLTFDDSEECQRIEEEAATSEAVKAACNDLKVLGKSELAMLLKWRYSILKKRDQALRVAIKKAKKEEPEAKVDLEADMDLELKELIRLKDHDDKMRRKKAVERLKKANLRKKMSMGAFPAEAREADLFKMPPKRVRTGFTDDERLMPLQDAQEIILPDWVDELDRPDEPEPEETLNDLLLSADEKRIRALEMDAEVFEMGRAAERSTKENAALKKKKIVTKKRLQMQKWATELDDLGYELMENRKLEVQEAAELEDADSDGDSDLDNPLAPLPRGVVTQNEEDEDVQIVDDDEEEQQEEEEDVEMEVRDLVAEERTHRWFSNPIFDAVAAAAAERDDEEARREATDEEDIVEIEDKFLPHIPLSDKQVRQLKRRAEKAKKEKREEEKGKRKKDVLNINNKKFEEVPVQHTLPLPPHLVKPTDPQELAEIQAIGSLLISKKTRIATIDGAYNRYTFDDPPNLPAWFTDEEREHAYPHLPVSKEMVQAYKAKLREINNRPIKKVQEAMARRKRKAKARLERIKHEARTIAESQDLNTAAKSRNIDRLMKKASAKETRPTVLQVSKKDGGVVRVGKGKLPKGAKVKRVDRRLKSDLRAEKRAEKRKKKLGKGSGKRK